MSRGKHSNGTVRTSPALIALAAGTASVLTGAVLAVVAVTEALRYSPYEDPGAGNTALRLGIISVVLLGIPPGILALIAMRSMLRRYLGWKRTLTPEQQAIVTAGELAALEIAHLAWRDHNRREDSRLTESVMGEKRSDS